MTPREPLFDGPNGSHSICTACGRKYGIVHEGGMGMWSGVCAICRMTCGLANAYHDFGMSDAEVLAARDAVGAALHE